MCSTLITVAELKDKLCLKFEKLLGEFTLFSPHPPAIQPLSFTGTEGSRNMSVITSEDDGALSDAIGGGETQTRSRSTTLPSR